QMDTDAFGIRLPEAITSEPGVQGAGQSVGFAGDELKKSADSLEHAVASADDVKMLSEFLKLAEALVHFFQSLETFVSTYKNQFNTTNIPDAGERNTALNFASGLSRKIIDYLVIKETESKKPQVAFILKTIGLIEWTRISPDPANSLSVPFV